MESKSKIKKDRVFAYFLISFFFLCVIVMASIWIYSDSIFPKRFQNEACGRFEAGEEISARELLAFIKSFGVLDSDLFLKTAQGSEVEWISTQGKALFQRAEQGEGVTFVVRLGLVNKSTCEIHIENGRIVK